MSILNEISLILNCSVFSGSFLYYVAICTPALLSSSFINMLVSYYQGLNCSVLYFEKNYHKGNTIMQGILLCIRLDEANLRSDDYSMLLTKIRLYLCFILLSQYFDQSIGQSVD